jgi:hypothetical protein
MFGCAHAVFASQTGRSKELKQFSNPAPDAYGVEKIPPLNEAKAPSFTMGARTRLRKKDVTPSPNTYTLQTYVGETPKYSMPGRSKIGGFAEDLAKTPGNHRARAHCAVPLICPLCRRGYIQRASSGHG